MSSSIVCAPPLDAPADVLVDWLELDCFASRQNRAHLDELVSSLEIQEDDQTNDIGELDALREQKLSEIEQEINFRSASLQDSYPFTLSIDGEVLELRGPSQRSLAAVYLCCLILSHVTNSPILTQPPADGEIRDVRKRHFQVIATLALAGAARGPSISLGWPRIDGTTILETVSRACIATQTGIARQQPATVANPAAKDGGIDVLAATPSGDRPPPARFFFGQAASGHKWPEKSARDDHEDFIIHYYDEPPNCNFSFATICPFRIKEDLFNSRHRRHGEILDRTRVPLLASLALGLSNEGHQVDEIDNIGALNFWVSRYRQEVRSTN